MASEAAAVTATTKEVSSDANKEEGSPEECLQISSPNLKSIEEEEEDENEKGKEVEANASASNMRKMKKKRGASPSEQPEVEEEDAGSKPKLRKKSWSNFKVQVEEEDVVSGNSLKDMVSTVSSIMEKKKQEGEEDEEEEEVELEAEEEEKELDKNDVDDDKEGEEEGDAFVKVEHLVRPFTLNQLKELLSRTGEIDGSDAGFYINKIKSVCVVRYARASGARDTVAALNNVKWPSTNPKSLSVTLTDREEFERLNEGGGNAAGAAAQTHREERRRQQQQQQQQRRERQDSARAAPRPLEELFRSTKTTPLLYWKTATN